MIHSIAQPDIATRTEKARAHSHRISKRARTKSNLTHTFRERPPPVAESGGWMPQHIRQPQITPLTQTRTKGACLPAWIAHSSSGASRSLQQQIKMVGAGPSGGLLCRPVRARRSKTDTCTKLAGAGRARPNPTTHRKPTNERAYAPQTKHTEEIQEGHVRSVFWVFAGTYDTGNHAKRNLRMTMNTSTQQSFAVPAAAETNRNRPASRTSTSKKCMTQNTHTPKY